MLFIYDLRQILLLKIAPNQNSCLCNLVCQRYNFHSKIKNADACLFLQRMYKIIRTVLFFFDPEAVHYFSMNALRIFCKIPGGRNLLAALFKAKTQVKTVFGIEFKNAVGLGAGFDKNASYLNELAALGFGFVEIGTVTPKPQAGNEKPRLFRLPKDKALLNRMGFNNDGAAAAAENLKKFHAQYSQNTNNNQRLIIGGNIGKNKITSNEDAWMDYNACFSTLHPYVDYFVVNVSSPNTPGLRALQQKDALEKILTNLQQLNKATGLPKPILLKIAPDLSEREVNDIADLCVEIQLDGLVVSNTTLSRSLLSAASAAEVMKAGDGGISGLPLQQRSTDLVQHLYNRVGNTLPIIASGGIFNGKDALDKMNAGAALVQVWTGFVYEGPGIVRNIMKHLTSIHTKENISPGSNI